jgi:DNA-binding CsgD family transcriptional regulator
MHFGESDLRRVLAVAAVASASGHDTPFGAPLLEALQELIPVDHQVVYYEFEHATHAERVAIEYPRIEIAVDQETIDSLCAHYPLRDLDAGGASEPLILSDFLSTGALRRNPFYTNVLRPSGVRHEMKVFLSSPVGMTYGFAFTRTGGPDFNERERCLLRVLRPHLVNVRARWTASRRASVLTNRENAVIALVAQGLTNHEVATRLVVSPGTVRTHLQHIFEKLDVHTRTAAVAAWSGSTYASVRGTG